MAKQEKCQKAMEEVAEALNKMFAVPLPKARTYEEIKADEERQEQELQAWAARVRAKKQK